MNKDDTLHNQWASFLGPNLGYVQDQYERYKRNPESVEPALRRLFDQSGEPPYDYITEDKPTSKRNIQVDHRQLEAAVAAEKLVWNIRTYGHLAAQTDPLFKKSDTRHIEPETFRLSKKTLSAIPASLIWEHAPDDVFTGWDAIQRLRQIYTSSISYEFSHVHNEEERDWLNRQVETGVINAPLSDDKRKKLFTKLLEVEQFEHFLHRTFLGQKRFSIEGLDMMVPMLDDSMKHFIEAGARFVLMGMAHRGRLNVLTHIFGKSYREIFSEFYHSTNKEMIPSEGSIGINHGWSGDVKYHLGASRALSEEEAVQVRLVLANNPSHLEFVNPIVEGFTRAAQEDRSQPGFPIQDLEKAKTILIHGDAAFPGEGVVAETLNFNNLPGYRNGGTLHIIANNSLGFTTETKDARSTHYASDLAKGFEIPIVHVNADDPEACIAAVHLAAEYRTRFYKDFVIDLVGYRRFGHNESDDPSATQPLMYEKVNNHPTVGTIYENKLINEGIIDKDQVDTMKKEIWKQMEKAYDEVKHQTDQAFQKKHAELPPEIDDDAINTTVPIEQLKDINAGLLNVPEGFKIYPKLEKILKRRENALEKDGKVDWALAETLAFATILIDGRPIRLTGQDTERGTFAHRHLILHDPETGSEFCPLHNLSKNSASFAIYNSPLSETSVLGFEYGYNVFSPETMVIWEAQYGDFVNAAQVIIDQFIAAGQAKWSQRSSLVLLLPHGYEGQGPDHSSARLERFLLLAAENNWTVANLTSAAQYFHLLRRQSKLADSEHARPLILMSPKSLIRNQHVASSGAALSEGAFHPVLEQDGLGQHVKQVERLILCTGKVAVDLAETMENTEEYHWLQVLRVEQLYPFPEKQIQEQITRYPQLKELIWMQEEPKNMGAWSYIETRIRELAPEGATIRYIGRLERSSPASGYPNIHKFEQKQIIKEALMPIHSQSLVEK